MLLRKPAWRAVLKLIRPSPRAWSRDARARAAQVVYKRAREQYQYNNLGDRNSFRLLAVQSKGEGIDPLIRISLAEFDIDNAPPYNALSYTWKIDEPIRKKALRWAVFLIWVYIAIALDFLMGKIFNILPDGSQLFSKARKLYERTGVAPRASKIQHRLILLFMPAINAMSPLDQKWPTRLAISRFSKIQKILKRVVSKAYRKLNWVCRGEFIDVFDEDRKQPARLIVCNGMWHLVGLNLYNALREVPTSRTEFWWVDAICVNQENLTERGSQVDLMAEIFGKAEKVIVWLGVVSPFNEQAPKFLTTLPSFERSVENRQATGEGEREEESSPQGITTSQAIASLQSQLPQWLSVLHLICRTWFRRVWVLQEAMLARQIEFRLGPHTILPEQLMAGFQWFGYLVPRYRLFGGLGPTVLEYFRKWTKDSIEVLRIRSIIAKGDRFQLEDYLFIARGRDATDPKDLAFAGFFLVDQNPRKTVMGTTVDPLKTDYHKTIRQIYQDCAHHVINGPSGIRILSLVENRASENRFLPSWVPDLRKPQLPLPLWTFGGGLYETWPPAQDFHAISVCDNVLNLVGIQWDDVLIVGEDLLEFRSGSECEHPTSSSYGILEILSCIGTIYDPTGEPTVAALWRTLIFDLFHGQHPAPTNLAEGFLVFFVSSICEGLRLKHMWTQTGLRHVPGSPPPGYPQSGAIGFQSDTKIAEFLEKYDSPEYPFRAVMQEFLGPDQMSRLFSNLATQNPLQTDRKQAPDLENIGSPSHSSFVSEKESLGVNSEVLFDRNTGQQINNISVPYAEPSISLVSQFVKDYDLYAASVGETFLGRRIFLTKKGYLGLGPAHIQENDTVMLVNGGYVPYIFRREARRRRDSGEFRELIKMLDLSKNGESLFESLVSDDITYPVMEEILGDVEHFYKKPQSASTRNENPQGLGESSGGATVYWILVGEAYVHGIMHGEGLEHEGLKPELIQVS